MHEKIILEILQKMANDTVAILRDTLIEEGGPRFPKFPFRGGHDWWDTNGEVRMQSIIVILTNQTGLQAALSSGV